MVPRTGLKLSLGLVVVIGPEAIGSYVFWPLASRTSWSTITEGYRSAPIVPASSCAHRAPTAPQSTRAVLPSRPMRS